MKNTDSTFNIVTEQFVESYNTFFLIQRGVVKTPSRSMRIFRSVYNKAVTPKNRRANLSIQERLYRGGQNPKTCCYRNGYLSASLYRPKKSKALQFARDCSFSDLEWLFNTSFKEIKHTEWVYYNIKPVKN